MIGRSITKLTPNTGSYLIDDLSLGTSLFAYSVRRLRLAYTGNCLRVRRSSDNAEQDIGFYNNYLDTAALASFVGSDSAYVVTWYDQGGGGHNATQATANRQPRIVTTGTNITLGSQGRVSLLFSYAEHTANDLLSATSMDMATNSTASTSVGYGAILSTGGTSNTAFPWSQFSAVNYVLGVGVGVSSTGLYDGTWRYVNAVAWTADMPTCFHVRRNNSTSGAFAIRQQSTSISGTLTHGNTNPGSAAVNIGNLDANDTSRKDFKLQEVIHWDTTDQSSKEAAIFTHQQAFYGT